MNEDGIEVMDTVWYRAIFPLRTSELCVLCDRSVNEKEVCSATVFKDCVVLLLLLLPTAASSNSRTEMADHATASVDDCRYTVQNQKQPRKKREGREGGGGCVMCVVCLPVLSPFSVVLHPVCFLPPPDVLVLDRPS